MGYQLSPLLWQKVRRGLSAGRVQSVAVRLIVEREREIQAFKPVEYWNVVARLESPAGTIEAKLVEVDGKKIDLKAARAGGEGFFLGSQGEAQAIVERLQERDDWRVRSVERTEKRRNPPPPFITSTLQQEAARKLGFQPRRTMRIAQRLYEGVELGPLGVTGLITYMRTDSTRTAPEAIEAVRGRILATFGEDYLPAKPNRFRVKKSAQDAHEAIRPTSLELSPSEVQRYLSDEELKLYTLIWNRFLASQMAPARFDQTTVEIESDGCVFRASGQVMRFDGFLRVYQEGRDAPDEEEEADGLPPVAEGERLRLLELVPSQHFTQPPPRYTQASLIRALEEQGIGRPSTYATIMATIIDREYVRQDEQKRLVPTELGMLVTDLLVGSFPDVLNVEFTAELENELDAVEAGRKDWISVTRKFWQPFKADLERAAIAMRDVRSEIRETDIPCEQCGRNLVIKWGRNGEFLACPAYPECKFTCNFSREEDGTIRIETPEETGETCDKCGSPMVYKYGRFGRFLGCSKYPECKNVKSLNKPIPLGIACPAPPLGCGEGSLVQRTTRRGKIFYGCDRYPKCRFASWERPVPFPCPECDAPFVVEKVTKRLGTVRRCLREGCEYTETVGEGVSVEP
ncbi:MAG: type I DNA topoisomerase [Candidatus Dadabacteria bacterium]|nr:MAG: type I DNA topoisomerase [Candidatus Dadabacteria bacterium]